MACMEDEKSNFKHYCRVCKKGFVCGRALGGHMRAHGIGDETSALDDDEDVMSDWEERFGGGSERSGGSKKMYQLRTNPNRLKSCRTCENCGKEFLSWKPFLEHRKCSSDESSKSLVSSPDSDDAAEEDGGAGSGGGGGAHVGHRWSKRKRSMRSKVGCFISASCSPSEEDDILLARCLVQLANTVVEHFPIAANQNKGKERSNGNYTNQNKGKGVVSATAPKLGTFTRFDQNKERGSVASAAAPPPKGMFECKACKKVFNSHQALGGHRASHKKVKGCYAAKEEQQQILQNYSSIATEDGSIMNGDEFSIAPSKLSPGPSNLQFEQGATPLVGAARRKSRVHECSICHRVFGSGQALGGHKRCHWITTPETAPSLPIFHFQDNNANSNIETTTLDKSDKLDLNIPAIDMQLQPWIDPSLKNFDAGRLYHSHDEIMENYNKINGTIDTERETSNSQCVEDEVDRKLIKLAKLSDLNGLKEMGNSGSSSQWLQVGIGPTAKAAADV